MPSLRLEIACGARAEVHVVDRPEVAIGRGDDNDLVIDHPSVDVAHARVTLRRERVLVVPNPKGQRSVRVGRRVVGAPVAVRPGSAVGLGDVVIHVSAAGAPRPAAPAETTLGLERPAPDGLRRFDAATPAERHLELAWTDAPEAERQAWVARFAGGPPTIGVAALVASGDTPWGCWALERIGQGVRLAVVLDAIACGRLTVPAETAIVITAALAAALAGFHRTWGPHGALDGRLVALGSDGSVRLLRPGPQLASWSDHERRRFLSPERRRGGLPTKIADAWSLARMARDLGAPATPWARLLEPDPTRRPSDVVDLAEEARLAATQAGLDPSTRHVAQLVDLVSPPQRPLARVVTRG